VWDVFKRRLSLVLDALDFNLPWLNELHSRFSPFLASVNERKQSPPTINRQVGKKKKKKNTAAHLSAVNGHPKMVVSRAIEFLQLRLVS
jgi:hypothetical protein